MWINVKYSSDSIHSSAKTIKKKISIFKVESSSTPSKCSTLNRFLHFRSFFESIQFKNGNIVYIRQLVNKILEYDVILHLAKRIL